MKKFVIMTVILGILGLVSLWINIPDYVVVNHQMVKQCGIYNGICD